MQSPDNNDPHPVAPTRSATPGGPYFGRLLVVLLVAVAFCALMTWWLGTTGSN